MDARIPDELRGDVEILWNYHDMHHDLHPVDVGVGLGSHDLGVAEQIAALYHRGVFRRVVFTGANAPTTIERFPRGEAVHYREHAIELGVPDDAILVEPTATNTSENFVKTRQLLIESGIDPQSLIVASRPYQQRRAYATAKKVWPSVDVLCTSLPLDLEDYVKSIGDVDKVINMLVGDTQRIKVYAERGFAIHQPVPPEVEAAYERLATAGFTQRLVS